MKPLLLSGRRLAAFLVTAVFLLSGPGCDSISEPVAAATAATPTRPEVAKQPERKRPSAGAVTAHIDGNRIEGFKGWYQNGILTLYTGEDPNFDYGTKISIWHLPQDADGQRIRYPSSDEAHQAGQMTFARKDPKANLSTVWLEGARYEVKLGVERDYRVEIEIEGQAEAPHRITLSGTVVAATAGIRITHGEVDRSVDHLDTIQLLTKDWIRRQHEVERLFDRPDMCWMEQASKKKRSAPRRQVAGCSYLFERRDGGVSVAKLLLEKIDGEWKEVQGLEPGELLRAHPIKPVRERPPYVFSPVAAKRFETDLYGPKGGHLRVREPSSFPCGGGQREGQAGYCEIEYTVYAEDRSSESPESKSCEVVTYLFEQDPQGQWRISRTLDSREKFDRRTQEVVERAKPPEYCG